MKKHTQECLVQWLNSNKDPKNVIVTVYANN